MNPKVTWTVLAVFAAVGLGYLASRVGNIGARSVRDGTSVELTVPSRIVVGAKEAAHWTTPLDESTAPVVLKARTSLEEVEVGRGEFGAGMAFITVPCKMGGREIGITLDRVNEDNVEEQLASTTAQALPQGPDCL